MASVIGQQFSIDLLFELHRLSVETKQLHKDVLKTHLRFAISVGMIEMSKINENIYNFVDEANRAIAYSRLLISQRTILHSRLASIIDLRLHDFDLVHGDHDLLYKLYQTSAFHYSRIFELSQRTNQDALSKALNNYYHCRDEKSASILLQHTKDENILHKFENLALRGIYAGDCRVKARNK